MLLVVAGVCRGRDLRYVDFQVTDGLEGKPIGLEVHFLLGETFFVSGHIFFAPDRGRKVSRSAFAGLKVIQAAMIVNWSDDFFTTSFCLYLRPCDFHVHPWHHR